MSIYYPGNVWLLLISFLNLIPIFGIDAKKTFSRFAMFRYILNISKPISVFTLFKYILTFWL